MKKKKSVKQFERIKIISLYLSAFLLLYSFSSVVKGKINNEISKITNNSNFSNIDDSNIVIKEENYSEKDIENIISILNDLSLKNKFNVRVNDFSSFEEFVKDTELNIVRDRYFLLKDDTFLYEDNQVSLVDYSKFFSEESKTHQTLELIYLNYQKLLKEEISPDQYFSDVYKILSKVESYIDEKDINKGGQLALGLLTRATILDYEIKEPYYLLPAEVVLGEGYIGTYLDFGYGSMLACQVMDEPIKYLEDKYNNIFSEDNNYLVRK